MMKVKYLATLFCITVNLQLAAQSANRIFANNTTANNRVKEYRSLVNNSINKNFSLALTDSTENNWQDAFSALELLRYHTLWVDRRIGSAFDSIKKRSIAFQLSFIELIYANYSSQFNAQIVSLLKTTTNSKLFAMCGEYLLATKDTLTYKELILNRINQLLLINKTTELNPYFTMLRNKLLLPTNYKPITEILQKSFLPGEIVLYSFQRKDRNFPGLAMVRNKDGNFITDSIGDYFSVPQLARSINNMPGYISNGNTPQGIFKMFGFAVSSGVFIGPTTNVQMVMPYEKSQDLPDSITQNFGNNYTSLLPESWKDYYPIYESYYAGLAGRTEIIAHGTTVNPAYYKNQPYYPLTPTQGCLCTKEIWSSINGERIESDQQKLVNALKIAGGANGYCVVIEIDDQQKPVTINDILPFLKTK